MSLKSRKNNTSSEIKTTNNFSSAFKKALITCAATTNK